MQKLFTNNLGQNQASTWVCINFNSSDHSRANQGIPGYLWLHLEIPSIKYFDFFVNLITPPWTTTPTLVCFGQSNDLIFFPRCCEIYCVLKKLSLWHKNTCTEHFLQIITGNLNMIWPQFLNGPQYATHNLTYGENTKIDITQRHAWRGKVIGGKCLVSAQQGLGFCPIASEYCIYPISVRSTKIAGLLGKCREFCWKFVA